MIKVMGDRIKRIWKKCEKPSIFEWIILVILILISSLIFLYSDIIVTSSFSIELINDFFTGTVRDFYNITINNEYGMGDPATYEIVLYILLGILDIPLYIYYKTSSMTAVIQNFLCLYWMKLTIVLFTVGTAILIYKICKEMGIEKNTAKWAAYLFLTAVNVFIPAFVISQYDIICLFFILLAYMALLKKRDFTFYAIFAVAITLKLFALFVFIPIVLLKEKRILHIIIDVLKGCSLLLFLKIVYSGDVAYKIATASFTNQMISRLTEDSIGNISTVSASVFITILIGVYIYAYVLKIDDIKEIGKWFVYFSFIIYTAFCIFCAINPYWVILYVPFSIILLFQNPKKFKVNLLLETIMSISIAFSLLKGAPYCFGKGVVDKMLLARIFDNRLSQRSARFNTVYDILCIYKLENLLPIVAGIAIACFIGIIFINFPKRILTTRDEFIQIDRGIVWFRMGLMLIIPTLILSTYFIRKPNKVVDTSYGEVTDVYYNCLENEICQYIQFDDEKEISEVELRFIMLESPNVRKTSLIVDFIRVDDNNILFSERVPIYDVIDDGVCNLRLDAVKVYPGKEYMIRINSLNVEGGYIAPIVVNDTKGKMYVGNNLAEQNIDMVIYGK